MHWQTYEEVVKDIYQHLGKAAGVSILGYGHTCKVIGKSGVEHQLDVLTSHTDGFHEYKTGIECKHWKVKVQKDTVAKLADICEDAFLSKGIIVSKSGFTEDAIAFAKYKNISLVTLREPTEEDWKGRVKNITININMLSPQFIDFTIEQPVTSTVGATPISLSGLPSHITIIKPDGSEESVESLFQRHLVTSAWQERDVTPCAESFQEGTTIGIQGAAERTSIIAVSFQIRRHSSESKVEVRGEDHVAMFMYSLFDNKRFVISPTGEIRPSEP